MTNTPFRLAVPSKGRIQDGCTTYFERAGLTIKGIGSDRGYTGSIKEIPDLEIAFLSASEIASSVESGAVHAGITGEDLVRENNANAEDVLIFAKALGFARADVVVAVPQAWIDVHTMADLDEVCTDFRRRHRRSLRLATKYLTLARSFFAEQGVIDYRIVESLGATEGAPASGMAEVIVDITSTGATLAANNLKTLEDGVILRSEAQLLVSKLAPWDRKSKATLGRMLDILEAAERARKTKEIRFAGSKKTDALLKKMPQELSCTIQSAGAQSVLLCPTESLYELLSYLRSGGVVETIAVHEAEYLYLAENRTFTRLEKQL